MRTGEPLATPLSSWTPSTDDDKVLAFIKLAVEVLRVDTKRVHMTGFSEGDYMTYRFLGDHADYFASVAPLAGAGCTFDDPVAIGESFRQCSGPQRPVARCQAS